MIRISGYYFYPDSDSKQLFTYNKEGQESSEIVENYVHLCMGESEAKYSTTCLLFRNFNVCSKCVVENVLPMDVAWKHMKS